MLKKVKKKNNHKKLYDNEFLNFGEKIVKICKKFWNLQPMTEY